jgi:hypothetical protein
LRLRPPNVFLMLAERHRSLEQLSRIRVAVWGAFGGALFPAVVYLPILASRCGDDSSVTRPPIASGKLLSAGD